MKLYRAKKAQSMLEFMQIYGYAILGLLVILSVLVYFGVQDIQRLVPDRCIFLSGLNCLDVRVVDTENETYPSAIELVLRNELGFDINNLTMVINGTCDSIINSSGEIFVTALLNKQEEQFGFACQDLTGMDVHENIFVNFINVDTGVSHRKVGYISLKQ